MSERILVTGAAGFIGMHLCISLLEDGYEVYGIDNLNDYYDPSLKQDRLNQIVPNNNFTFSKSDIVDLQSLEDIFQNFNPVKVVNLAAQAGVRYSLENPHAYIQSNILGFMNILECCRKYQVEGLIYASSSSVYGGNKKFPFSVKDRVDNPISIYAASKKSNELMAYSYSHLYNLHTTGLRFFTVYGPWGRPDMAMYIFADKISKGEPIHVFNHGNMKRDFTYINDIISGTRSAIKQNYECEVFNLGNNNWVNLMDIIEIIGLELSMNPVIQYEGMQLGDVKSTYADIEESRLKLHYNPTTNVDVGIKRFIEWYIKRSQ
ncbi:MAG: protein CapI [Candidatus Marinimicrobia bacterium]|nr:protein CapI [Candidatus Neomarinimicrobiota bacterium]|tara:strand:+ start:34926 stop:35882 length:957 start_codon:yes stop_codon:yes gene_type:complete